MIPNVFISSTIADLHYLRDGLRDVIQELAYRPVMSDYSEVGYLENSRATDACYQTVQQCQMAVVIVGKRYGSVDASGLSITHREYQSAQKANLPTITFVEASVLSYREVYLVDPQASIWDTFHVMDNPRKTFALLDEIDKSETYNAWIPFTTAADAKRSLKLQLADFVGNRLQETTTPVDFRDLLAEVKTLRNLLAQKPLTEGQPDAQRTGFLPSVVSS
ncbi:MAG TPA: DUF4062 domain-containing protein [Pirellulales bacterium]|nr:DUF4062 domain-containing protein [Pirellulales bacterium]